MSEPGVVNHLSTFDADLRNVSFALISFMGFPKILSALQPLQMCIYNGKYSKLTFSNDSQLMGNRFIANLHALLESTCKSRLSRLPPDVRTGGPIIFHYVQAKSELKNLGEILVRWGVNHLPTFDADLRNVSFALISFMGFPKILSALQPFQICIYNGKYSKLTFSNDSQLMGNRFIANLHASLESSCKSRISWIATRCQNWGQSPFTMCRLNLN